MSGGGCCVATGQHARGFHFRVLARRTIVQTGGTVGSGGAGGATVTQLAEYTATFARGDVVYLEADQAFPVNRTMDEAVTRLLALITIAGPAGTNAVCLLIGRYAVAAAGIAVDPGMVFLGNDGRPTSADDPDEHYVPIGFSDGGDDLLFQPSERLLRP